jgi:hypothetical protein
MVFSEKEPSIDLSIMAPIMSLNSQTTFLSSYRQFITSTGHRYIPCEHLADWSLLEDYRMNLTTTRHLTCFRLHSKVDCIAEKRKLDMEIRPSFYLQTLLSRDVACWFLSITYYLDMRPPGNNTICEFLLTGVQWLCSRLLHRVCDVYL